MTTLPAITEAVPTDPYARGGDLDPAIAEALAARLETRGATPQQRALRQCFLSRLPRQHGLRVLEVGCGTGIVARDLAALPGVEEVVGIDPVPQFIDRARANTDPDTKVRFEVADGRSVPFGEGTFNAVVFATTLCHVVDPSAVLGEARRVLVPDGTLLVFDGDYVTTTVALSSDDPLQACVAAALTSLVNNPWLVRELSTLVAQAGFNDLDIESHGYIETTEAGYAPTVIDYGATDLAQRGVIGADTAAALQAEARRRIDAGIFFGHISYVSLLARHQKDPTS